MATNSTEAALTVLDYQIEFNMKLIIFGCIIFYAILLRYIQNKTVIDNFAKSIFVLFSKVYVFTTALFLPLFSIMLFREYEVIKLWTLLLQAYGVVFVIMALVLIMLGWQKILDLFNIPYNIGIMGREQKRRGEE